jgi:hypothetical protein
MLRSLRACSRRRGFAASVSSDDAGGAYPFDFSGGAQLLIDEDDVDAASELLAGRTGGS